MGWVLRVALQGRNYLRMPTRTPRRVPANRVILWPGHYRLDRDITVEDTVGIRILCSNVVLNLAGHRINHAQGASNGSFGVLVEGKHSVTIKNGTIDGFWHGIHIVDMRGAKVIGNTVCNAGYMGIHLSGSDSEVSGNSIRDQRLDSLRETRYVVGIQIRGTKATVESNTIEYGSLCGSEGPDAEIVGILVSAETTETDIKDNRIVFETYSPRSYGVWVAEDAQIRVTRNEIRNVTFGVTSGSPQVEMTDNVILNDRVHQGSIAVTVPTSDGSTIIRDNAVKCFERAVYAPGASGVHNEMCRTELAP